MHVYIFIAGLAVILGSLALSQAPPLSPSSPTGTGSESISLFSLMSSLQYV
jgi:hypothetical protein